jgi:hypothetical protein
MRQYQIEHKRGNGEWIPVNIGYVSEDTARAVLELVNNKGDYRLVEVVKVRVVK